MLEADPAQAGPEGLKDVPIWGTVQGGRIFPRRRRMSAAAGADRAPSIPVTIVGGYLGAGKTTLVNALLRQANGLRLAVARE